MQRERRHRRYIFVENWKKTPKLGKRAAAVTFTEQDLFIVDFLRGTMSLSTIRD